MPGYTLKDTHNFIGWALTANGQTQSEFIVEKTTNSLEIFAKTDYQYRDITYTIKKEKPDGSFEDPITETKSAKIGSVHSVSYSNPDDSTYQNPSFDKTSLTVNSDANQNKVEVTIKRKVYDVTFEVKGHSSTIAKRTIRHGATIGAIDESQFSAQGFGIVKTELDGVVKSRNEIENLTVTKNHKVTVYVDEPTKLVGKYPQTKVDNPVGIQFERDDVRPLKFNSNNVDNTINFTRKYYIDNLGNRYEMYNGNYYKFEDVEFVKIPKQNTWFTKKIIDFTLFNFYISSYPDNAKPERSIFKAMVEEIGKILETATYMPTYDDGDFSVKPILDASGNVHPKLKRESTDYAKAVLNQYSGHAAIYRGVNLQAYPSVSYHPYYNSSRHQYWWLGAQYPNSHPCARRIHSNGNLDWHYVHFVFGVVVCIR